MKKLFGIAITALALIGFVFTSCASTKGGKVESVHPREYTFDLYDSGEVCDIVFNQYGPFNGPHQARGKKSGGYPGRPGGGF